MSLRWLAANAMLALTLSAGSVSSAHALPGQPPGGDGSAAAKADLDCIDHAKISFSAAPSAVPLGGISSLKWSVQLPANCQRLKHLLLDDSPVQFVGSRTVQPMSDAQYTLEMPIAGGMAALRSQNVSVQLPNVVNINGSDVQWKHLLVQAIARPYTTVYLASNVDMDLSGYEYLSVGAGVSIIGGQPCAPSASQGDTAPATSTFSQGGTPPGTSTFSPPTPQALARIIPPVVAAPICGGRTPQFPGPRLFTNTRPKALLVDRCDSGFAGDNVHLGGFRFQGPHWDPEDGDANQEQGIQLVSCQGTEISNMELSGWSGQAIYLENPDKRALAPDAVRIHDNFIHHNQHIGGNGYGVDVSHGAWATIEHNVFDFNRHSVTAGSIDAGTGGYVANQNLILSGGGVHGRWYEEYTQQFDVHGDNNCVHGLPASLTPGGIWNCGHSGEAYYITNNAFQYTNAMAFKLRGTPAGADGVQISNNVFAHSSLDDAVGTDGWDVRGLNIGQGARANTLGLNTRGHYGVCDLDGDGKDDLFLATGASWWYMSSAKHHWVYLNSYTDTLDQLALGDFEGSGKCDVFAVHGSEWVTSSGGTAPWKSLGRFDVPFDQLGFGHFTGGTRMEIFRRAPDGQWSIVSPGVFDWTQLQRSPVPLSQMRFGALHGGGVTDVIAFQDGRWLVSWAGNTPFEVLNADMPDSLDSVLIGDLEGNGVDDILRYVLRDEVTGEWQVSRGGRTAWQRLDSDTTDDALGGGFIGRFEGGSVPELLEISGARMSSLFNPATHSFSPYNEYAY